MSPARAKARKPAWVKVLRELGVELTDHQVRGIARIRRQMMAEARESALRELAHYTIVEPSLIRKAGALRRQRVNLRFEAKAVISKSRKSHRKVATRAEGRAS